MGGNRRTGASGNEPWGNDDDLDARIRDVTDEERASEHAALRRVEATLRHQAEAEGTMGGVLVDLAERGVSVAIATVGGRTLRGTIHTLGLDYVGLRATGGEQVVIALAALSTVRTEPAAVRTVGDRVDRRAATLQSALATLAERRPWVSVLSVSSDGTTGRLWHVGQDVLTIRADGGAVTYAPIAMVSDIVLP